MLQGIKNKEKLNTYTVNFSDKIGSDNFYANLVTKNIGSNHSEIKVNIGNHTLALQELLKFVDEPMSDSSIISTYMLSKFARDQGIKVLLSGAGGEKLFGGL